MNPLAIAPLHAFEDNYIWLLREPPDPRVAVVDPGDADPVLAALRAQDLELTGILLTHHHSDHTGGVAELRAAFPRAVVVAPAEPRIPAATRRVGAGDPVHLPGFTTAFTTLFVPGHTATHVAYLGAGALFCGDTLFGAGCGRVFDGTYAQLAASLQQLAHLPTDTQCYCAHEYTLANLGFAAWVEPESPALAARTAETRARRAANAPTVPATLGLELATNPFLRTAEPAVVAAAERFAGQRLNDPAAVFESLRRWKDTQYD